MAFESEKSRRMFIEKVEKDIGCDVDGFYYFAPCIGRGTFSAWSLREIADLLDEKNTPWQEIIDSDPKINGGFEQLELLNGV